MPVSISNIDERRGEKSSDIPVKKEYDELWGFYTFKQTVSYDYDEIGLTGLSSATITIDGCFTINAEHDGRESEISNLSDEEKCDELLKKYNELRKVLLKVVNKPAPDDINDIGTEYDERCVLLPDKLLDNNNQKIYAIPISFSATDISPLILLYSVQLKEPIKIPCKLAVDGSIINDARVVISCRRPRINYRTFAFASGSEAYITGIDNRKYTISGSIPNSFYDEEYGRSKLDDFLVLESENSEDGEGGGDENEGEDTSNSRSMGISDNVRNFISNIICKKEGRVGFVATRRDDEGGSDEDTKYVMVSEHSVSLNSQDGSVQFEISGEECLSNSTS